MTPPAGVLSLAQPANVERLIGVSPEALASILEDWLSNRSQALRIVVVANERIAEKTAADLEYFNRMARPESGRFPIHYFPPSEGLSDNVAAEFDAGSDRLAVLDALRRQSKIRGMGSVVVATIASLSQKVPDPQALESRRIELVSGQPYGFGRLIDDLERLDYDHEGLCEAPGQFAKRGGLVDVYPITDDRPYRIDFFGDEIESIKALDPVTQRSGESTHSIRLTASPRLEIDQAENGILEYLESPVAWALVEPEELLESLKGQNPMTDRIEPGVFWARLQRDRRDSGDTWATVSDLDLEMSEDEHSESTTFEAESLDHYRSYPDESKLADDRLADEQGARIRFLEQIREWEENGERIVIVLPNESDERRIEEVFKETASLEALKPLFWRGDINEGFRIRFRKSLGALNWPMLQGAEGAVFVTETELFGRRRSRKIVLRKRALVAQSQVDQLLDFAELIDGEFVVHLQHGIAVYRGISQVDVAGQLREALTLEFDDGISLHVPLQESHLISRYVGDYENPPKIGQAGIQSMGENTGSGGAGHPRPGGAIIEDSGHTRLGRGLGLQKRH